MMWNYRRRYDSRHAHILHGSQLLALHIVLLFNQTYCTTLDTLRRAIMYFAGFQQLWRSRGPVVFRAFISVPRQLSKYND